MLSSDLNQQSLNTLKRIITKFNGKFSLTFVNCNDRTLGSSIVSKLEQDLIPDKYSVLVIAPTTQSLHQAILTHITHQRRNALIIVGLETVVDIDKLLARANAARDQFLSDFQFPVILWVNDSVSKKLSRLAPDFNSWGTSFSFVTENSSD